MFKPGRYANVTATLALIVALGGTGYAAVKLPKDSVGAKQIKRNAVTGAKVKARSLRASDFRAGDLPTGPKGGQGPKGDKGDPGVVDPSAAGRVATNDFPKTRNVTEQVTSLGTAAVTAPARGFLVADLRFTAGATNGGTCPCIIRSELAVDGGDRTIVGNTNLGTAATDYIGVGAFDRRSTGGSLTVAVEPGQHTVEGFAFAQLSDGFEDLGMSQIGLTVQWVPFDGAGAPPPAP